MKITNAEMIDVINGIREYKQLLDNTPAKLTYTVSKHEPSLTKHYKDYDEARVNLCKELCEKDTDGKPLMTEQKKQPDGSMAEEFIFTDENRKLFGEKLLELQKMEIEVPDYKCSIDVLDKIDFSPAYFPHFTAFAAYFFE